MEAESNSRCNEHTTEDVVMLCTKCKALICSVCCYTTHAGHKFQSLKSFTQVLENQAKSDLGKIAKNPKASNIIESPQKKNPRSLEHADSLVMQSPKALEVSENRRKKKPNAGNKQYLNILR